MDKENSGRAAIPIEAGGIVTGAVCALVVLDLDP